MMNTRQQQILCAITRNYIETAEPVASKTIVLEYDLDVSSATVRSEMSWLEDNGYLYQPHISSGRIPTDRGYRFYVDKLMARYQLTHGEQQKINREYQLAPTTVSQVLQRTIRFVSDFLCCTSLITSPDRDIIYVYGTTKLMDQPEFSDSRRLRSVLAALDEKQELINMLADDLDEDMRYTVDWYLNA